MRMFGYHKSCDLESFAASRNGPQDFYTRQVECAVFGSANAIDSQKDKCSECLSSYHMETRLGAVME